VDVDGRKPPADGFQGSVEWKAGLVDEAIHPVLQGRQIAERFPDMERA